MTEVASGWTVDESGRLRRETVHSMNRLRQWIAGEDAAEINYHGMKPENIDALACAAAKV